ncbi:MAG: S-methyl-5'-thioadenosine phosphorylase [Candidatus Marinimicrobia bacterium]|nr:S-methyl-5'-thioadenosine phosphorylase [Candidatus Neomarinimicrobiota bacterium]
MLGIIGGTGFYNIEGLDIVEEIKVETPFGEPSAPLIKGRFGEQDIIFLPRHGNNHQFLPFEVNYRANIFSLKSLGVTKVIGVSAVGSLQADLKHSDFVIPSQYFDWTMGKRDKTFFGNGIAAHVSTAEPTCLCLTQALSEAGVRLGHPIHTGKTYACVEGPRLGTKAESNFLRNAVKADVVGMTNVPEAFLAREAQMCYATLAIVTDYDCWMDDPEYYVSVQEIFKWYGASIVNAKALLLDVLKHPLPSTKCSCRTSLSSAVLTSEVTLSETNKSLLNVLKK